MRGAIRWRTHDRQGNEIYLSQERWDHIIDSINHPEMRAYENEQKETIETGKRNQDSLNPRKYRYSKEFLQLAEDNTHIVAIVLFAFVESAIGEIKPNNYIVTAFQKEII